ncbi:hypothetical protein L2E82_37500 [Cichorium intybus]|uniref:Uncharacterized protein n=1 Tax=Cichorium intybus TaxID=13427 RepID=A0ACB9AG31_CICIN|nr:hypothetical protein L2E82_37500 [Cichorium intybus]
MAQKKPRLSWKLGGIDKTFLEACLHEVTVNGREGSSLKASSWRIVGEIIKKEYNIDADQKQMKNRYDYIKGKFGAWLKLKNKTGNVYNPITNTFNLSEEEWQLEMKSNKYVESLRSSPLPCPDICIQLFDGATSTGFDSWGPTSTLPRPSQDSFVRGLNDFDDIDCTQTEPLGVSEESSARSKKQRVKRKSSDTSKSRIMEIGEDISKVAKMLVEKHAASDIDACMEKLEKLEWGKYDARYSTALMLFGESVEKRQVWLSIDSNICENWVRNAGAKLLMDLDDEITLFTVLSSYWLRLASRRIERPIDNNSALSGHAYTQELLHGSSTQCHELMRLSREAYILLCNHFRQKNWLQSSRSISVEEKLAIFLTIIGHNERFRMVKRRFQHSTETIYRCFHEVLNAMLNFAKEMIVPTSSNATANTSERLTRLKNIFPGAIGALDGTLIHAVVPADQQTRYRGRGKGECFQNVLAICDFDMIFTFVWAGWEGIAHDSRVLKDIAYNPTSGFLIPPSDKYYLCDAAYTNTRGFMTPYRNTRYWLSDYRRRRATTKEERFNHAHAQLRNVIERAYGVLKKRFPILKQMAPYPFSVQRDVVIACFAVHNFIRKFDIDDELFMEFEEDTMIDDETQGDESNNINDMEWGSQANEYMANLRDQIANQLFSTASN